MAREISPVCNCISGFIRTCLLTDMVDVDLTIRTIKGIYMYCKDHTMELTLWSKSVTPFPSLRQKIQVFKGDKRQNMTMPWDNGNMVQFSAPPKMPRNSRKHVIDKIRTIWSNRNHRFNPIKTNRYSTLDTKMTDMKKIDIIKPTPSKVCEHFGLSCSYCRQYTLHPSPVHSDWSSKNWDSDKAKAGEQKSLIDFEIPKQKMDTEEVTDIDKVPFHKLSLGQDEQKEGEPLEVTKSLAPLPSDSANMEGTVKDEEEGLMEVEVRLQKEEEKFKMYDKIYVNLLSEEETSNMETDELTYSYFG